MLWASVFFFLFQFWTTYLIFTPQETEIIFERLNYIFFLYFIFKIHFDLLSFKKFILIFYLLNLDQFSFFKTIIFFFILGHNFDFLLHENLAPSFLAYQHMHATRHPFISLIFVRIFFSTYIKNLLNIKIYISPIIYQNTCLLFIM